MKRILVQHGDWKAYLLVVILVVCSFVYSMILESGKAPVRFINTTDALIIVVGAALLLVQPAAGFPSPLDKAISNKKRFLLPLAAGIVFGLLDVVTIKIMQHPHPYTSLPPFLQPFPYSLFLFTYGAVFVEVTYRLIPFMIFMLPATRFTTARFQQNLFMVLAVLTSLYEPIDQFPSGEPWFRFYAFSTGFLMNFLQAWCFRQYGFFSALSVRLGHYLIWHILLGLYVQLIEL
jgi:hypothetical protein